MALYKSVYYYYYYYYYFKAHQHKAAGRKTRLDIQNYGYYYYRKATLLQNIIRRHLKDIVFTWDEASELAHSGSILSRRQRVFAPQIQALRLTTVRVIKCLYV